MTDVDIPNLVCSCVMGDCLS